MAISEKSRQLYDLMIEKGYPEDFAGLIASEMHTDFTATRMIGYIARSSKTSLEEVADKMLAILSDRDRITQKHMSEHRDENGAPKLMELTGFRVVTVFDYAQTEGSA